MSLFDYFRSSRRTSAAVAKERLQILVAHERGNRRSSPAYLPALKKELLDVVRKYVPIEQDQIKVHLDRDGEYEVLEVNIMLPDEDHGPTKRRAGGGG
ncbi:MAG: cell division topological specificity factor MinE [Pseudomonadota bacterium]|nr:cell division topological specificity factor MinE [Pseudomonadota bacterium]